MNCLIAGVIFLLKVFNLGDKSADPLSRSVGWRQNVGQWGADTDVLHVLPVHQMHPLRFLSSSMLLFSPGGLPWPSILRQVYGDLYFVSNTNILIIVILQSCRSAGSDFNGSTDSYRSNSRFEFHVFCLKKQFLSFFSSYQSTHLCNGEATREFALGQFECWNRGKRWDALVPIRFLW